ncbi:MAG: PEP-CTERM sorting domain-containing protein [Bryobacterales bacterium]|nr:PEP-CTERM sorting domain-containing protein [Bryobacterales bacterium]
MVLIRLMLRSALGLVLAVALQAAPIQWKAEDGGNDNWYEYVPAISTFAPVTFDGSKAAAEASTHLGLTGYLATITSADEQAFIVNHLGPFLFASGGATMYIGATDTVTEGSFVWVGGPEAGDPIGFAPWLPGQPLGGPGFEDYDYVQLLLGGPAPSTGAWIANVGNLGYGYIVEYGDGIPDTAGSAVPEPSTVLLSGLGLLASVVWRRLRMAGCV